MYLHRSQKLVYNTKHFISTCKVSELNYYNIFPHFYIFDLAMWIHFLSFSFSYRFCSSAQADLEYSQTELKKQLEEEKKQRLSGGHVDTGQEATVTTLEFSLEIEAFVFVPSVCWWCFTIIFSQPLETWRIWKSWPANPLYLLNLSFTVCRWPEQPIICKFTRVWLCWSDNLPTREDMIYLVSSSTSQQSQLCRRVTSCPRPRTGPGNSSQGRPELAGFWWVSLLPLTIT